MKTAAYSTYITHLENTNKNHQLYKAENTKESYLMEAQFET